MYTICNLFNLMNIFIFDIIYPKLNQWNEEERKKKRKKEKRKKERKNIHYIVDSQHFLSCDINRLFELCVQTDLIL